MMGFYERYSVAENVTDSHLNRNGFRGCVFRCYIYKDLIQLMVRIDTQKKEWEYRVINTDSGTMYISYYDRTYGKSYVVNEIDKKIEEIFKKMEEEGILKQRKENCGEKKENSKIRKNKHRTI